MNITEENLKKLNEMQKIAKDHFMESEIKFGKLVLKVEVSRLDKNGDAFHFIEHVPVNSFLELEEVLGY